MMVGRPMVLMSVTRVHTRNGSHIEPPLDASWSELLKLRWKAGVLAADTGVVVEIQAGGMRDAKGNDVAGYFRLFSRTGNQRGPMRFGAMWDYLNGMEFGIECSERAR